MSTGSILVFKVILIRFVLVRVFKNLFLIFSRKILVEVIYVQLLKSTSSPDLTFFFLGKFLLLVGLQNHLHFYWVGLSQIDQLPELITLQILVGNLAEVIEPLLVLPVSLHS